MASLFPIIPQVVHKIPDRRERQ